MSIVLHRGQCGGEALPKLRAWLFLIRCGKVKKLLAENPITTKADWKKPITLRNCRIV